MRQWRDFKQRLWAEKKKAVNAFLPGLASTASTNMKNLHNDVATVKVALNARAEELCKLLLPGGQKVGQEWRAGDVGGGKGDSLKVALEGDRVGLWKDFAGAPEDAGDLLALWQRCRGVSFNVALHDAASWAGVAINGAKGNGAFTGKPVLGNPSVNLEVPAGAIEAKDMKGEWDACVEELGDVEIERLAKWRGYSPQFCQWLRAQSLVGLYKSQIAFPVCEGCKVIGWHYRIKDDGSWRYFPTGIGTRAFIIGGLSSGMPVWAFESQWDLLAALDACGWEDRALFTAVATRGAGNAGKLGEVIEANSTVVLWPQNDEPGLKWSKEAARALSSCRVKIVTVPSPYKDVADWHKAGAGNDAFVRALREERLAHEAAPVETDGEEAQAQPFPTDCLPPIMKVMAEAIADTERTPQSLAGCCVLGIVSASIGAGLQVRSGPDRTTPGNLYIVGSAESGSGKSESFRYAARPFHDFEGAILERWTREELPGLQAEKDMLESEILVLKKKIPNGNDGVERTERREQLEQKKVELMKVGQGLVPPALSCEDTTTERLASLLQAQGECLASLSSDAGTAVNNLLGRYNKLNRTDESIYLKAYSRDFCKVDRQTRPPVLLRKPCLTLLWLTQPDKIETMLAERSLTDGGLIPRLLPCHTNCQPKHIVNGHGGIPKQVQEDYRTLICVLLETYRMGGEAYTIEPTPAALELLNAHHNMIVDRRLNELHDVTSYAARWTEQAWRLSVVLHAGLHLGCAHERLLGASTAQAAIVLANWFAAQQLAILAAGRKRARTKKRDEILSLLADHPVGITSRDVQRAGIVRDAEQAHDLLASLEFEGVLQSETKGPTKAGGRRSTIYRRKAAT